MRLLSVLAGLLGLTSTFQDSDLLGRDQVSGPLGARLDSQLTRFAAYGLSGTVLVVRDGQVLLLKGYGWADVERRVANSATTRFEMNSMTKMFTGAAVLQLAAQGRLRVTDPVAQHLPGFPPTKRGATIEQLAMHTAGLVPAGTQLAGDSREAFVRDVARAPSESKPGERYRYSNAGFSLLAAVIETVSGASFEQYLRDHLFTPAGMGTAVFRDEVPSDDPRFARGYVGTPATLEPGPPNPYVWGTRGAGGVWSTVGDMYRWLVALEQGRVLPEDSWRLLVKPPPPPAEEAFGWHADTAPDGRQRIHKGGGSDDFASQLLYYPRERVVIIWATNNLRQRWRRTLNQALPEIVFATNPLLLPPVASLTRVALEARRGRYLVGRDTLDLVAGVGYLYVPANRLDVPTDVMFFPQDRDHFTGFDPATGSVTRLEFTGADRQSLGVILPDGRKVAAQRAGKSGRSGAVNP